MSQTQSRSGLDFQREVALKALYDQLQSGTPFTEEEAQVLRWFSLGLPISELEADTVISRVLYAHYVSREELSAEQAELLRRYREFAARPEYDLLVRKRQVQAAEVAEAGERALAALAPPSNDDCRGAEVIPRDGPFPYLTAVTADITDATTTGDPPAPSCAFQPTISRSIWYTFTPLTTAIYTIETCSPATATTVNDTAMAIYTSSSGCAGAFAEVACNDDSCDLGSSITMSLTAGTTYYIIVWKFGNTAPTVNNATVQLRVTRVPPPPNDTCAGTIPLSLNAPVNGTTISANNDYRLAFDSVCFTGIGQLSSTASGRDVVYSFTAPSSGKYSFRLTSVSFDPVIYTARSCPSERPPATVSCTSASNRSFFNPAEEISCQSLMAGEQVFVFVDDSSFFGSGGTFTLLVTECNQESEPNNTPVQANVPACGIVGSISPAGDVDFYSLDTPASGSRVFALVDGVASNTAADLDLRVTTTTDTLEYDDSNNDTLFDEFSPNVAGTPLTGVASFLRINDFSSTTEAEPYRLYPVVQPAISSATAETEPNNTTAAANFAPNNYFLGKLSIPAPSTDVDFYKFTASAGDRIFLSFDGDPFRDDTPIDGKLELLDSNGNVLTSVNDDSSISFTTPSPGTLIGTTPRSPAEGLVFVAPRSGIYYAKVSIGTTATDSTGAGDYLLSISLNCKTGGGIAPIADLSLTKTGSPNPADTGSNVTYTITVNNAGPLTAESVAVSDAAPAGTTFVSVTPSQGSCTAPAVGSTGSITCNLGSVPFGGSASLTLVVKVAAVSGTITNTATVTSTTMDPRLDNNSAVATNTVSLGDLAITMTDSPDPVVIGSNLTYMITVNNIGPDTATGVVINESTPAGTTFVSATPSQGTCMTPSVGGTGVITCTLGSVAPSGSATIQVVVVVSCSLANGATITSTATVSAATSDPDLANSSATTTTTTSNPPPMITCLANILTTTTPGQSSAIVTYPSPTVTDNCPGSTVICSPPSGSSFPVGTTTVTCSATDSGSSTSSCTFTVTVSTELLVSSFSSNNVLRYNGTTGAFIDTFASGGSLSGPTGTAFGPDGNLYVSSSGTNGILCYNGRTGEFMGVFATGGGLARPSGLAFGPDAHLYVSSQATNDVNRYNGTTGAFIGTFVTFSSGGLSGPSGLVFGPDDNLYISSFNTNQVLRYNGRTGEFMGVFAADGGLNQPAGLVFGPDGNLYVSSQGSNDVKRYNGTTAAFMDIFASSGGLNKPAGLVFGPDGSLYVVSQGTNDVKRYNGTTGVFIDTFASGGGLSRPTFLIFK